MSKVLKIFLFGGFLFITTFGIASATNDFTLNSLSNQSVSLHDFLGHKTVVMNFWASWCDSCEEEMPQLLKLKEKYAGDSNVVFLGINAGDSPRAAQKFVDKLGYSYNILLDTDKKVAKTFGVMGLPQTLVLSKEGEVIYRGSRPPVDLTGQSQLQTPSL